jgi:DNA-binding transcriptional regulator YiaG
MRFEEGKMKKKYQSKILGAIHETACDLYEIGAIDEKRMKEYDDDCLVPKKVKKNAAKSVSSSHVNVPPSTVYASPK